MAELVSGGHGFIGKHLSERLTLMGRQVYLLNREEYSKGVIPTSVDNFYHLASYGSQRAEKDADLIYQVNVVQLWTILQALNKSSYKGAVIVGSSSEYGIKNRAMCETDKLEPTTHYAASKVSATNISRVIAIQDQKPIVIARPFTVYGPGESDTRFVPTVIRSCVTEEPIKVADFQEHDWIHVDDFVDVLIGVAEVADQYKGEEFNVGTGIAHTNRQVVNIIESIVGKRANIVGEYPSSKYESPRWVADITKLKSHGWHPRISLHDGLIGTVKFYEDKYRTS